MKTNTNTKGEKIVSAEDGDRSGNADGFEKLLAKYESESDAVPPPK